MLKFLIFLLFVNLSLSEGKLELVTVLIRHGDRTPVQSYPTDLYTSWPEGWGQLTPTGMEQEFNLGSILKRLYVDTGFLSPRFNPSQIYVRSTNYTRTKTSAQCVLTGLYPYEMDDHGRICAQFSVNTVPRENDTLLPSEAKSPFCPAYLELLKSDIQKYFHDVLTEHKEFFDDLQKKTGMPMNMKNVDLLEDTLTCELAHNLKMPSWFNTYMYRQLQKIVDHIFSLLANTHDKKRLAGGVFANQVLEDMEKKMSNQLQERKMILYAAHDITLTFMLNVFGLYNHSNLYGHLHPKYSAAFVIELWSYRSQYYVKFHYHKGPWGGRLVSLDHPQCRRQWESGQCPVEQLQKLLKDYRLTPTQRHTACNDQYYQFN